MKSRISFFKLLSIAAGIVMLTGTSSLAVHDLGLFELDGNTANDPVVQGDDWSDVHNGTSQAFATSFIVDTFANGPIAGYPTPENSFFTGGGSKDTNDVPQWQYDTTNSVVPDKNDIVTAFAAAYDNPSNGHTIFYFGLDTYAVQGDSNAGFWFFRKPVTLNPLATGATTGSFNGQHSDGDIFVAAAYTGGGKVATIDVYKWNGTTNELDILASGLDCSTPLAGDSVCGVVNSTAGEDPPWNYLNKEGGTSYQVPAFVEFGLDVTALLGQTVGCFSTFMAETRSSQSVNAQLKDFALGAFPVCGIDVKKESGQLSKVGDTINYTITVTNTGRATLYKKSIADSLVGDLSSNAGCGSSLAPGASCTITYPYTVKSTDSDPLENKVDILYTEYGDYTGLQFAKSYTNTVNLFQPKISFDKKASGSDGPLTVLQGATVPYTLTVKNESSADTPDLTCTVTDTMLGIDQTVTLTSGAHNTISTSHPFAQAGTYTNTANVSCSPAGFSNVLTKSDSVTVKVLPAAALITVVKEGDAYSKTGDLVDYTVKINNIGDIPVNITAIVDQNNAAGEPPRDLTNPANYTSNTCPAILAVGAASCTVTFSRTTLDTDPDPLNNEVAVTISDGLGGGGTVRASHSVDLLHPNFTVTKSCLNSPVPAGQFANFRIDIANTGDPGLLLNVTDTLLGINKSGVLLGDRNGAACTETDLDDNASDGCYRLEGSVQATGTSVENTATVLASLPQQYGLPNTIEKTAVATCDVLQGGATRTWGFWKTHGSDGYKFLPPDYPESVEKGYTCYVATTNIGFPIMLGWTQLDNCEDVFGLFWESKAKCSQIEQAKIQASRQFLAAMLNYAAFSTEIPASCIGNPYQGMTTTQLFAAMKLALASDNRQTIQKLAGIFACYNESGDKAAIVDTVPVPHADPKGTRAIADFDMIKCGK